MDKLLRLSFLWLWLLAACVKGSHIPCSLRDYGSGNKVCVCNSTYCDTIIRVPWLYDNEFITYISSEEGLRFEKTKGQFSKTSNETLTSEPYSSNPVTFTVNITNKYQTLLGFGGAFTDSAGINIMSLGKKTQKHLLRSYFSENGIEYNLCRVPIGGTDFSTHSYSYDDGQVDPDLENFQLTEEDLKIKIPLIKEAMKMSVKDIRLKAASWSPPTWMKSEDSFNGHALLQKKYYLVYTNYLLRFLDEYKKHGLEFWGISTGNEPANGLLPKSISDINSLGWTPWSAADWVVDYLGPLLRNSEHKNTVLLAFDDQRLFLPWWIELMVLHKKELLNYVDGFAVHWYWDFLIGERVITDLFKKYPEKIVLYSESCYGDKPWEKKVDIGSWHRGETYLASIIENINAGVSGWLDWNLALDLTGGPNWVKNFVDSPILVNASANEFYKQPMFYAMGHVSKFIEKDAVRVEISPTDSSGVHAMAVLNPDGRIVVIMYNGVNKQKPVSINIPEKGWMNFELPARSFATFLFKQ